MAGIRGRVIGLDIGNYRLKVSVGEGSSARIVAARLPDNLVKNNEIVAYEAMSQFIKEILKKAKISSGKCSIVMPGGLYHLRRTKVAAMTVGQLKVNLPYEFHDYISQDTDSYVYDYSVLGNDGNELDIMTAALQKDRMNRMERMCREAGLKLTGIVPDVLCLQNVLERYIQSTGAESKDFVLLDIGHVSTTLYFFRDGIYEISRDMSFGGDSLSQKVADETGVDIHIAQLNIEKNQNDVLKNDNLVEIYESIATEINRVLNFYNYNNPGNKIECIYFCGGGSHVAPLMQTITNTTGMAMRSVNELIDIGKNSRSRADFAASPQAFGATLQ
ncbi:MAG: pilus assembly protein PilM [Lachnospiraceae bacterium]|nr:pilus assembly protein PilM [Lachnospiraceae bacterium]